MSLPIVSISAAWITIQINPTRKMPGRSRMARRFIFMPMLATST